MTTLALSCYGIMVNSYINVCVCVYFHVRLYILNKFKAPVADALLTDNCRH